MPLGTIDSKGGSRVALAIVLLAFAVVGWPREVAAQAPRDSARRLDSVATALERYRSRDSSLKAARVALRAAALYERAGDTLASVERLGSAGRFYLSARRPDSTLALMRRILPVFRQRGEAQAEANTLSYIGQAYESLAQADSSRLYYQKSLAVERRIGKPARIAVALIDLGTIHEYFDARDSALVDYREALGLARQAGDSSSQAYALEHVGRVYQGFERNDSALVYLTQALALQVKLENQRTFSGLLIHIGNVHFALDRSDSARFYYDVARRFAEKFDDQGRISSVFNNFAELADRAGQPDSAMYYVREALRISRQINDLDGILAQVNNIGVRYYYRKQADSALKYLTEALAIERRRGDTSHENGTLANIASVYLDAASPPNPRVAAAYFDSSTTILARLERQTGDEVNRLTSSQSSAGAYIDWSHAWLERAPEVGEENAALAALAAAERGRSQSLADMRRGVANRPPPRPGGDLVAEGRALVDAAVRGRAPVVTNVATLDRVITWLILPNGRVSATSAMITLDSLLTLARRARAGAASRASGRGPIGVALGDRGPRGVEDDDTTGSGAALRTLSSILLPRALLERLPAAGDLVVVPQGPLSLVPFAALPLPDAQPIAARFALRFAPSLAILASVLNDGSRQSVSRTTMMRTPLVVGNPNMPAIRLLSGGSIRLDSLPSARAEATWLATRLHTVALLGPSATETTVRSRIPSATLIHLATHGYAYRNEETARASFIALAPDARNDGVLTIGEILDDPAMTFVAELVVLSACQTAVGVSTITDGALGLQRALLAKGARSMLVSLWSVDDEATSALMRSFYTHWLDDADAPNKGEALRRAQHDLRTDAAHREWGSPKYWAAFQLVGAP